MGATHRPHDLATSPIGPLPTASCAEDGGLEPHPESYSGLVVVNHSRHLAASSSTALRSGLGRFALLVDAWSCAKYAQSTVVSHSGGSSPARTRPASAGLRDSGAGGAYESSVPS